MATESDSDRDVFFDTDEFGVSVTVGASSFNALLNAENSDDLDIDGTTAVVVTKASEITTHSIVRGTSLTIASTTYLVREIRADGTGITELVLERQ